MLDQYRFSGTADPLKGLVAPFWGYFNQKLTALHDPIRLTPNASSNGNSCKSSSYHSHSIAFREARTSSMNLKSIKAMKATYYKPIQFDAKWYRSRTLRYVTNLSAILKELTFLTMDSYCIQELLFQSNPKSLNPIISYDECIIQGIDHFIQCNDFNLHHLYLDKAAGNDDAENGENEENSEIDDAEHSSLEVHDSEDGPTWSTSTDNGDTPDSESTDKDSDDFEHSTHSIHDCNVHTHLTSESNEEDTDTPKASDDGDDEDQHIAIAEYTVDCKALSVNDYSDENLEMKQMLRSQLSDDEENGLNPLIPNSVVINEPINPSNLMVKQSQMEWIGNVERDIDRSKSETHSPGSDVVDGDESVHSSSTFMLIDFSGDDEDVED